MENETQHDPVNGQGHTPDTPDNPDKSQNIFYEFRKQLFWLCVIFASLLIVIFILLPATFASLGAMWPQTFSGSAALQVLGNHLNSLVGYVSMVVGIASIFYAYTSNRSMKVQSQNQQLFLDSLRKEIELILSTVYQIRSTNEEIAARFDRSDNLGYSSLNTPESANEQ